MNDTVINTVFFVDRAGEQYKIELFCDRQDIIDRMLDQFNLIKNRRFITAEEFHLDKPFTILLTDDDETVIAHLTCEERHVIESNLLK